MGVTNHLILLNSTCPAMVICEEGAILENRCAEAGLSVSKTQFGFTLFYQKGSMKLTLGPPPCIFRARTVATRTTTLGTRPEALHLMLKNFSMPISAPKPASVTAENQVGNLLWSSQQQLSFDNHWRGWNSKDDRSLSTLKATIHHGVLFIQKGKKMFFWF